MKLRESSPEFSQLKEEWHERAKNARTIEDFEALYNDLLSYAHDYGTIVHATWELMYAAFALIEYSEKGGLSGFQAAFLGWNAIDAFIRSRGSGARILFYDDLLYPQYDRHFCKQLILRKTAEALQAQAKDLLVGHEDVAESIHKRWTEIAEGRFPSFVEVTDEP
jgi:hypothetical protein